MAIMIVALIYVQMQVTIYDLAYQGKNREDQVSRLADSNMCTHLDIAKLKSARSLGEWFARKGPEIDFIDQGNIVEVKAPRTETAPVRLAALPQGTQKTISALARFFSLKSIAEAQPVR